MQLIRHPARDQWEELLRRPAMDPLQLDKKVGKILAKVRKGGDKAVRKFTKDFDGIALKRLEVSQKEFRQAVTNTDKQLQEAILVAMENITAFHTLQLRAESRIDTMPGVSCWRRSVGIDRVGLYIPGGTAALFSTVLMLGVPARLAGCQDIVLCTPPQEDGCINPAVLFAATITGITKVYKVGGAQAIAAMAYGTETIPKVYKIFGPGNQYVNCAKQLVQLEGTAIDMPAGPSEVCVLADESANASYVAADLLSQAEHGADSQVLLITDSARLAKEVGEEIQEQLQLLPRMELAKQALQESKIILVKDMEEAIEMVNAYAAEHLIVACADAEGFGNRITNAGSVFLGNYSPESVGDYASGTNHSLPTNGFARAFSGVSVDSFVRKITYQRLTKEGLKNIGGIVTTLARAEGLEAHARAVEVRLE